MPSISDPAYLLIYGLDESLATAVRVNSGSLGSAQDLTPWQSTGTDGVPAVNDENGGKAAYLDVTYPSPFNTMTTAFRALRAPVAVGSAHTARPVLPIGTAANDFAFGGRFKWVGGETDGGVANEGLWIFGLGQSASNLIGWGFGVLPEAASTPQNNGQVRLVLAGTAYDIGGVNYTETGSPGTYYVAKDLWYRLTVRVFASGSGYLFKVYLYEESTGVLYTFTRNTAAIVTDYPASHNSATDVRVFVGIDSSATNPIQFFGYVDHCWLFDAPMTDGEATSSATSGITIPWTEPSYRRAPHDVYNAVTREGGTFPKPRQLPAGALQTRVPLDVACKRPRFHYEGGRPGRPWLLREQTLVFDTTGPYSSRLGLSFPYEKLGRGLRRSGGKLDPGTPEDARDVVIVPMGFRRRRGFQVRRIVSTETDVGANGFWFFRDYANGLHGLFKVGTKLYAELGTSAVELDSAWNATQLPVAFFIDNRLVILSGSRRKTWRGNTSGVSSFGIAAPAAPTAATAGGSLTGTYYYAYTEYDPVTGDESAPGILVTPISPAGQGVTLTLAAVSSDTRFTQRRIYRTTNGGAPPELFLLATITSATSYTDTAGVDGTDPVDQALDEDGELIGYITADPPDTFSIGCVHMERAFYGGGATNPERIYPAEAGEVQRWLTTAYLTCEGPVRAIASWGHKLVAFTDNTVELFESDWVRSFGTYSVQHTVIARRCGAVGPHAVVNADDAGFFWMDRRGIYRMGSGGQPECLSDAIEDLFPYVNHGISHRVVGAYNHLRKQIVFSTPQSAFQEDSGRFQTLLVAPVKAPTEWLPWNLEASFIGQFDDDLNGLQFGCIDHLGVFKQLEGFEGDGCEGDESFTTEDEGGDEGSVGIQSISGSVITVFGSPGWTSAALRGVMVLLRDRSTGERYAYLVSTNGTGTLTVVGTPNAALAARDGWYLGGMRDFLRIAEHDLESPNNKIARYLDCSFADLDGSLYL